MSPNDCSLLSINFNPCIIHYFINKGDIIVEYSLIYSNDRKKCVKIVKITRIITLSRCQSDQKNYSRKENYKFQIERFTNINGYSFPVMIT